MKSILLLAVFALCTSAAFAQTVAPGTTPGATTGNPSNMPSAGSPTDSSTTSRMSGNGKMHGNKRRMKDGSGTMKIKTKTSADGTTKTRM